MTVFAQQLLSQVAKIFPDGVWFKQTKERTVALTIDDAPTPDDPGDRSTEMILDAIAASNREVEKIEDRIRATFFIIAGHLNDNTTIIERILSQGHEIGNHGIADESVALLKPKEFARHFQSAHQRLSRQSKQAIRWYRPGRGFYNQGMIEYLQKMSNLEGYEPKLALASMIPLDTYKLTNNPKFTAWYVSHFIFPGSILVLHGGSQERASNTAAALKLILNNLKQKNYRVVTLSELFS